MITWGVVENVDHNHCYYYDVTFQVGDRNGEQCTKWGNPGLKR